MFPDMCETSSRLRPCSLSENSGFDVYCRVLGSPIPGIVNPSHPNLTSEAYRGDMSGYLTTDDFSIIATTMPKLRMNLSSKSCQRDVCPELFDEPPGYS